MCGFSKYAYRFEVLEESSLNPPPWALLFIVRDIPFSLTQWWADRKAQFLSKRFIGHSCIPLNSQVGVVSLIQVRENELIIVAYLTVTKQACLSMELHVLLLLRLGCVQRQILYCNLSGNGAECCAV